MNVLKKLMGRVAKPAKVDPLQEVLNNFERELNRTTGDLEADRRRWDTQWGEMTKVFGFDMPASIIQLYFERRWGRLVTVEKKVK